MRNAPPKRLSNWRWSVKIDTSSLQYVSFRRIPGPPQFHYGRTSTRCDRTFPTAQKSVARNPNPGSDSKDYGRSILSYEEGGNDGNELRGSQHISFRDNGCSTLIRKEPSPPHEKEWVDVHIANWAMVIVSSKHENFQDVKNVETRDKQ